MSLELASAKASEDLINLKEARSRRRSTSDVATTPPPDPTLLVSWQGVDEIDDDIMSSASDDDDADSEGCPPEPPSPLPTPQKSNKKMLRRASVAICAPSQPPSLPKFGARRRTTTDLSHQHQKSRLHRVSWPGVDEADTDGEDEECTSSPPSPAQPHKQPPIKKLFRRCSLSMGDHHVEVDIVPKADTTNRQTFTKSLSGRRIVVESTDEPSDISDSFVPRSSPHLNNNRHDDVDVSNSQHHLDESASSKGFDLRQLFAKQKQQGRSSPDTDEEKCCDSPISANKNKIDTSHSSRNRGGCGAEGGLDESSSSRLFGQLFQRKNSRRASTPTTTVKKEEEVDTRGDINRRIAFHKERAALLNDESDRFLA